MAFNQFGRRQSGFGKARLTLGKALKDSGAVLALTAYRADGVNSGHNSPLLTDWKDLSGKGNDATLRNLGGTISDGWQLKTLPNGKIAPVLTLDGIDTFGELANTASLDILGLEEFILSVGIVTGSSLVGSYIFSKGLSDSTNIQYGVAVYATGSCGMYINANYYELLPAGSLQINSMYRLDIVRRGGRLKGILNKVPVTDQVQSAGIVSSRPNVRIGARSNVADGSTQSAFFKGNLGWLTIHRATYGNLDLADKAIDMIAKNYF